MEKKLLIGGLFVLSVFAFSKMQNSGEDSLLNWDRAIIEDSCQNLFKNYDLRGSLENIFNNSELLDGDFSYVYEKELEAFFEGSDDFNEVLRAGVISFSENCTLL